MTRESTAMAKELKRRVFRFVGPTTAYALMQATGMVDDHVATCWVPLAAEVPRGNGSTGLCIPGRADREQWRS